MALQRTMCSPTHLATIPWSTILSSTTFIVKAVPKRSTRHAEPLHRQSVDSSGLTTALISLVHLSGFSTRLCVRSHSIGDQPASSMKQRTPISLASLRYSMCPWQTWESLRGGRNTTSNSGVHSPACVKMTLHSLIRSGSLSAHRRPTAIRSRSNLLSHHVRTYPSFIHADP